MLDLHLTGNTTNRVSSQSFYCESKKIPAERRILLVIRLPSIIGPPPIPHTKLGIDHFFPLFLMPCVPVFRGPLLAFAFAASSALALASDGFCVSIRCTLLRRQSPLGKQGLLLRQRLSCEGKCLLRKEPRSPNGSITYLLSASLGRLCPLRLALPWALS